MSGRISISLINESPRVVHFPFYFLARIPNEPGIACVICLALSWANKKFLSFSLSLSFGIWSCQDHPGAYLIIFYRTNFYWFSSFGHWRYAQRLLWERICDERVEKEFYFWRDDLGMGYFYDFQMKGSAGWDRIDILRVNSFSLVSCATFGVSGTAIHLEVDARTRCRSEMPKRDAQHLLSTAVSWDAQVNNLCWTFFWTSL